MNRIFLQTFGCRANQYDSAALVQQLTAQGFVLVSSPEEAEVALINSCAITLEAENEVARTSRKLKRKGLKTVITGCAAQVASAKLAKDAMADLIVGNLAKSKLTELLNLSEPGDVQIDTGHMISSKKSTLFHEVLELRHQEVRESPMFFEGGVSLPNHTRTFLKIQDGCSQFCSYCIVPFSRGLNRSIEPSKIREALFACRERGIQEVVLTGIHLGTYGHDLKPRWSLARLLEKLVNDSAVPRLRLSSVDPEEVGDDIVELMSQPGTILCPHLHVPIQSVDDDILRRMRRRYTRLRLTKMLETWGSKIPDLCLGTDMIVGFPGETDDSFLSTLSWLSDSPLAYIHSFPFSARPGTKAAGFQGQVDERLRKQRSARLRDLSGELKQNFERCFHGVTTEVLTENRSDDSTHLDYESNWHVSGLTRNYLMVKSRRRLPSNHRSLWTLKWTQDGLYEDEESFQQTEAFAV
jgi:threonylcarbamoyladenosine tRNA methylthiotransferase MtaB